MAIYHLSAQVIGRSSGRSSVAAAAYRAGARLTNERDGVTHDYTRRDGVEHSEIMAPADAPEWARDRGALWNAVEAGEKRKDAQLAREVEFSLPRELSADQRRELVRAFVGREFVARGMVADVAIHCPKAEDGLEQPHAHVMLTMRGLTPEGFGGKIREWNDKAVLGQWREGWAVAQNEALERAGIGQRVDHRSLAAQGSEREPALHLGPAAHALESRGQASEIGAHNRAVAERNTLREQLHQAAQGIARRLDRLRQEIEATARETAERLRDAAERLLPSPALAGGLERLRAAGRVLQREDQQRAAQCPPRERQPGVPTSATPPRSSLTWEQRVTRDSPSKAESDRRDHKPKWERDALDRAAASRPQQDQPQRDTKAKKDRARQRGRDDWERGR